MTAGRTPNARQALGRGLSALLPQTDRGREYFLCPIEQIRPAEDQPRKRFDAAEDIDALSQSIREEGVLQPIVVRAVGNEYRIIAGERRWRAAQRAGLKQVPVVIRDVTSDKAFELALVENLNRRDLNPIEEAEALGRLIERHGYTQEEAARKMGRSRVAVTNSLRILKLPEPVRRRVASGELSEGHARALLAIKDASDIPRLAEEALRRGWSVRALERAVRQGSRKRAGDRLGSDPPSPQIKSLVGRIEKTLGVRVRLVDRKGKGRLELHYSSLGVLDRILDRLLR